MERWDVFLILAEVVAFVGVFWGFSSKLYQTLGEFRAVISQLKKTVEDLTKTNRETHKDIFDKLDDHETRISHLEK